MKAFLNQHLSDATGESAPQCGIDVRFEVDDAAAFATQGEGAAQHYRQAYHADRSACFQGRVTCPAAGGLDTNLSQTLDEQVSVFGIADGLDRRAQNLDAMLRKHTAVMQRETAVQGSLAAERERDRIHALFDDDFLDEFRGDGDEIDAIRQSRAGLDSGDVRVHQNRGDTFFTQRLDCLRAGVIELARLSDLQRARAEYHDSLRLSR